MREAVQGVRLPPVRGKKGLRFAGGRQAEAQQEDGGRGAGEEGGEPVAGLVLDGGVAPGAAGGRCPRGRQVRGVRPADSGAARREMGSRGRFGPPRRPAVGGRHQRARQPRGPVPRVPQPRRRGAPTARARGRFTAGGYPREQNPKRRFRFARKDPPYIGECAGGSAPGGPSGSRRHKDP